MTNQNRTETDRALSTASVVGSITFPQVLDEAFGIFTVRYVSYGLDAPVWKGILT